MAGRAAGASKPPLPRAASGPLSHKQPPGQALQPAGGGRPLISNNKPTQGGGGWPAPGAAAGSGTGWEVGVYRSPQQLQQLLDWFSTRGVRERPLAAEVRRLAAQHDSWRRRCEEQRAQREAQHAQQGAPQPSGSAPDQPAAGGPAGSGSVGEEAGAAEPMQVDGMPAELAQRAEPAAEEAAARASEAQRLQQEILEVGARALGVLECIGVYGGKRRSSLHECHAVVRTHFAYRASS